MAELELIRPRWPAPSNVVAFTTTRNGGLSQGKYASLNLGLHVGDVERSVKDNRARLQTELPSKQQPNWLNQVHGTHIHRIPENSAATVTADGAMSGTKGVICCVMTADCMPLFLCDRAGTEVAVVHAGWRGMAAGIIEQAVAKFSAPAEQLLAWAGPTISVKHFEVGTEVREELGGSDACWRRGKSSDKAYADLYAMAGERLEQAGVSWYQHSQDCTYDNEARFFSYRRDGQTGRMASLIYLRNAT